MASGTKDVANVSADRRTYDYKKKKKKVKKLSIHRGKRKRSNS